MRINLARRSLFVVPPACPLSWAHGVWRHGVPCLLVIVGSTPYNVSTPVKMEEFIMKHAANGGVSVTDSHNPGITGSMPTVIPKGRNSYSLDRLARFIAARVRIRVHPL
jgi:hypothetical protein